VDILDWDYEKAFSPGYFHTIAVSDSLKQEVRNLNKITLAWKGRPFQEGASIRTLHSDSSTHGRAGVDLMTGDVVQELENPKWVAHKYKRAQGCPGYNKKLSKTGSISLISSFYFFRKNKIIQRLLRKSA
jgi:hypothetical protein